MKDKLDRINFTMPLGLANQMREYKRKHKISLSKVVQGALRNLLEGKDNQATVAELREEIRILQFALRKTRDLISTVLDD